MKGSESFKDTIERYVVSQADSDPLFAERAGNPKKNIEDCVTFIINQVQKSGVNGFTDDEIYSLATHYYVEEDIDVGKPVQCHVVVNHQVELTAKEIEEERRKAREKVFSEEAARLRNAGRSQPASKPKPEESDGLLFSFD